MNRLSVLLRAVNALKPSEEDWEKSYKSKVDSKVLSQLMENIRFVVWPTVVHWPLVPSYVDAENRFEWVVQETFNLLVAQIQSAFLTHGDRELVKSSREEFAPAPPLESVSNHPPIPFSEEEKKSFRTACRTRAMQIALEFILHRLVKVRELLNSDAEVTFRNDPGATSVDEVIHSYPGLHCMVHQRVAHALYLLGVPNELTRALTEQAHAITGIDIHPHTKIGHHFFIDHGTGVVIGATAIIGNYVSLYQGVTLGAKSFPVDRQTGIAIKHRPRHPIIEDHVTIYANAVVLGRVTIGKQSTIGGNCWVVTSLPPHSVVVQKSHEKLETVKSMFEMQNCGSGI